MIAQASHDENNKYVGGKAGDQTGKEVLAREWYSRPWDYRIRLRDKAMRERFAYAMERAVHNDNIGYDQYERNSLAMKAEKVGWDPGLVTEKCECDCSSLVVVALICAGIPKKALYNGTNAATTKDLRKKLMPYAEISKKPEDLSSEEGSLRGDIWLYEGHHVAAELDDHDNSDEAHAIPGIDVSEYQGEIDWKRVAAADVKYAVIRCVTKDGIDKQFEKNYKEARAAGLNVGVYAFCYDRTETEAINRADRLLEVLNERALELPIFYDLEWELMSTMKKEEITAIAKAFAKEVEENSNYSVGFYMNMDWYRNHVLTEELLPHDLWIASSGKLNVSSLAGRQYAWNGRIDGVKGNVDLDYWYKMYERKEERPSLGWRKVGTKWKYENEDGEYRGWLNSKGFWYFIGDDGFMVTGPQVIGDECFFFCETPGPYEGAMMRTNERGALVLTPD